MSALRVRLQRLRAADHGLSLVELLVVMVLVTVIGAILTNTIVSSMTASRRGQERIYALTALETAAQRMSREIRSADPIVDADADSIDLWTYRDPGRSRYVYQAPVAAGSLNETRTIYSDPTTATPVGPATTRPLILDLDQTAVATFTYFKEDGTAWDPATETEDLIHRVGITLVRDLPEQGAIRVETSVYLRNQ